MRLAVFSTSSLRRCVLNACLLAGALASPPRAFTAEPAVPTAHPPDPAMDVLVLPDGDRLTGQLIGQDGDVFVFRSRHLGEVRASIHTAHIEAAPGAAIPPHAAELAAARSGAAHADATPSPADSDGRVMLPWWKSPAALSDRLLDFFGQWHGRFALGFSLTEDTGRGENLSADLTFSRKWTQDEARFEAHYFFSEADDEVKTDMLKATGIIRHDFPRRIFVSYRPTIEWNRNHFIDDREADYVLGLHAVGVGVNLYDRPSRKVRLGVAENIFDVWTLDNDKHSTRDAQSLFGEVELELPWRMSINARGTWYYMASTGDSGFESQFELIKKFSDTLSLGLRREARENNPDDRIADYSLLRMQVGLDF